MPPYRRKTLPRRKVNKTSLTYALLRVDARTLSNKFDLGNGRNYDSHGLFNDTIGALGKVE
jgi:hypothetical protein